MNKNTQTHTHTLVGKGLTELLNSLYGLKIWYASKPSQGANHLFGSGLTQAGSWQDILLPTRRLCVCVEPTSLFGGKAECRPSSPLLWALPFMFSFNSHGWLLVPLITPLLGAVSVPYGWKPLKTYAVIGNQHSHGFSRGFPERKSFFVRTSSHLNPILCFSLH